MQFAISLALMCRYSWSKQLPLERLHPSAPVVGEAVEADVQVYGDVDGVLGAAEVGGCIHVNHAVGAGDGAEVLADGGGVGGIAVVGPHFQPGLRLDGHIGAGPAFVNEMQP